MVETSTVFLALSFFVVAVVYSSVGFGGGSSYLALLALFLPDFLEIKSMALLCNLAVVLGSTYLFYKEGQFNFRLFLPLVAASIPMAFGGATLHFPEHIFFIALGAALAFSGTMLMAQCFFKQSNLSSHKANSWPLNAALGAGAGFVSGVVGIGGGILLSPVLHLMQWADARKIAALASFFILVNSLSGLAGLAATQRLIVQPQLLLILLAAVTVGGQIGSRLTIRRLKPASIKAVTGALVFYVGVKLVLQHSWDITI